MKPHHRQPGIIFYLTCFVSLFFLLPASASAQETVVRFAVIGDSGTGDQHQYKLAEQMARWHQRWPYSLVLMLGDNIYGSWWRGGRKQDFEKKFDQPYAELLRRGVVFRAALGNHDMYTREGRDLIEDWERFHIDGKYGYYSFTAAEVPRLRPSNPGWPPNKHLRPSSNSSCSTAYAWRKTSKTPNSSPG